MHLPSFTFSSGVGGVSASNSASTDPRQSTASGQHGLSGQTAQELVEAESCTGSAPVPARGNKRYSDFRWFPASQIHCDSCRRFTVQMKKPFVCDCFYNPPPSWARKKFLKATRISKSFFSEHLKVTVARLLSTYTSTHTHAGVSVHPHTQLIRALICQSDSPDRQTISPHAPDKENLLIACSFLSKLPRQSANIPPCCSLTQT